MKYFILVIFILSCHQKPRSKIPNILGKVDAFGNNQTNERSIINDTQEIHLVAKSGDIQKLKELINQGQDIHLENKNGQTAFHIASGNGHLEVVKLLLIQGVGVDRQDKFGYTALQWASLNGHVDVAQELLTHNANLSFKNKITGGTALHLAVLSGHLKVVQLLILKMKEGNTSEYLIVNKFGQTPYELALEKLDLQNSSNNSGNNVDYQAIVDEFEKSFPET